MLMVDGIECVSRGDNTASRQVVCDATSRRDATRRDTSRRRKIRRVEFSPSSSPFGPSRILPIRPTPSALSFIPDAFEFTSAAPEGSLGVSSRYIVALGLALHLGIESIDVSRGRFEGALKATVPESFRVSASAKDHRYTRACDFRTRVRHRCSIAQYRC